MQFLGFVFFIFCSMLHLSCLCKTKTQGCSFDEYWKWEISSVVNLLLEKSAVSEKNVQILLVWVLMETLCPWEPADGMWLVEGNTGQSCFFAFPSFLSLLNIIREAGVVFARASP